MMEWIQSIIEGGAAPVLVALTLGLMTAVSPCPLATNIAAVGYIGKSAGSTRKILLGGFMYTLGRMVGYSALGIAIAAIIKGGSSAFGLQKFVSEWGEKLIGPLMIVVGLLMLAGDRLNIKGFGIGRGGETLRNKGIWGALLLGVLFSMAFCPTSVVLFFGMLIPMSVTSDGGLLLPPIFALATAIPVILVAWIFAFSASSIGKFYNSMGRVQKWLNVIVGILFIVTGVYYLMINVL